MNHRNIVSKFLFFVGILYLIYYALFLVISLQKMLSLGLNDGIFSVIIFVNLICLYGAWQGKKIFSKSFWKYFLIFEIVFSIFYFVVTNSYYYGINQVFIYKLLLFAPVGLIAYLYCFRLNIFEDNSNIIDQERMNCIKKDILFFIAMVIITLNYNPFPPKNNITPEQYNSMSYIAANSGDFVTARKDCYKGLKAARKAHRENSEIVAKIYSNLSLYYKIRLNQEASILYCKKSIAVYEKLFKQKKIQKGSQAYHIFAEEYCDLAEQDSSMNLQAKVYILKKALNMFYEIKDYGWIIRCYQSLGNVYTENKDFSKAKDAYEKAISISKNINDKYLLSVSYKVYADSFFQQKKYKKAEKYAKIAIRIFTKNGVNNSTEENDLGNSYMVLSKIEAAEGKCGEAVTYMNIGIKMMNKESNLSPALINLLISKIEKECKARK